jgi:hypothetical protein
VDRSDLEALVDEALTDAYGPDEQANAWASVLEDAVDLPFDTTVLGVGVTVTRLEPSDHGEVRAVCVAGPHRQHIALTDLPLPDPLPAGAEWVAAYRLWSRNA